MNFAEYKKEIKSIKKEANIDNNNILEKYYPKNELDKNSEKA
jgi:hypothetical protein